MRPSSDPPETPLGSASGQDAAYRLLDAGGGERLEQWGPYRLRRPDPRAIMRPSLSRGEWNDVDARYHGEAGKGRWERVRAVPEKWTISHGGLTLVVKLAPFKHTGVFPEQAANWEWLTSAAASGSTARDGSPLRVLNLFAYTGGATVTLAKAGHHVTHVDASKPAITWARENAAANGLAEDAVRWIQDDAGTFVRREVKRGKRYDAVLLDPPAFGRTPEGRVWKLRDDLPALLASIARLLEDPVFVLINDYSRDTDHDRLASLIESTIQLQSQSQSHPNPDPHPHPRTPRHTAGRVESGTLRLPLPDGRALDTGAFVRWQRSGRTVHRAS
jgi:23S rRNA (cytosine1962-C5)-methyltransferase